MKPIIYGFVGGSLTGALVKLIVTGSHNIGEWSWFYLACAGVLALLEIGNRRG